MVMQDIVLALLKERKMSQAKLAELTGIPASTLNRYLKHGADMPVSNAKQIAAALGITIDELMGLPFRISSTERELVECYRCMTPRFQNLLLENARAYADNGAAKNNQVAAV